MTALFALLGGVFVATTAAPTPAFAACVDVAEDCTGAIDLTKRLATGQSATVLPGETVTYQVAFSCSSNTVACGELTLVDTLDPRLDYVSAVASSSVITFSAPRVTTVTVDGQERQRVTITGSPFNDGYAGEVTLVARVKERTVPGQIPNSAAASAEFAPQVTTAPVTVTVPGNTNWRLNKALTNGIAPVGLPTRYTVSLADLVGNNDDIANAVITDTFDCRAVDIRVFNANATVPMVEGVDYTLNDTGPVCTIVWETGPLSASAATEWQRVVELTYPSSEFQPGDQVANQISAVIDYERGGTGVLAPGPTVTSELAPSEPRANAVKSGPASIVAGQPMTYQVRANVGISAVPIPGLSITDLFPADFTATNVSYAPSNASEMADFVLEVTHDNGATWRSVNEFDNTGPGGTNDLTNDSLFTWCTNMVNGFSITGGIGAASAAAQAVPGFNCDVNGFTVDQSVLDGLDGVRMVFQEPVSRLSAVEGSVNRVGFSVRGFINTTTAGGDPMPAGTLVVNCTRLEADAGVTLNQPANTPANPADEVGEFCAVTTTLADTLTLAVSKVSRNDPSAPIRPGTEVFWTIAVSNPTSNQASTDVVISDLLPAGLSYLSTDCYTSPGGITSVVVAPSPGTNTWNCTQDALDRGVGGSSGVSGVPAGTPLLATSPVPTADDPVRTVTIDGVERDLVTWTFPFTTNNNQYATILVRTIVDPGTPIGTLTNTVSVLNSGTQALTCSALFGTTAGDDVFDVDDDGLGGDGDDTVGAGEEPVCSNTGQIEISGASEVQAEKWVAGTNGLPDVRADDPGDTQYGAVSPIPEPGETPDQSVCPVWQLGNDGQERQTFTRFPCVAQVVPNGEFQYRWKLTNVGTTPLTNYVVYDVLPHQGDTGVGQAVADSPRDSDWGPHMVRELVPVDPVTGAINPSNPFSVLPAGANPIAAYSPSVNPCRPELATGDVDAEWAGPVEGVACAAYRGPNDTTDLWFTSAEINSGVDVDGDPLAYDWADVQSIRVELFSQIDPDTGETFRWEPNVTIVAEMTVRAPANAPPSTNDDPDTSEVEPFVPSIAWNSLSHRVFNAVSGDRVPAASPRKVGIITPYSVIPEIDVEKYSDAGWSFAEDAADDDGLDESTGQPNSVPEDFDDRAEPKPVAIGRDQQLTFTITNRGEEDLIDVMVSDETNAVDDSEPRTLPSVLTRMVCDLSSWYPDDAAHATWDFATAAFTRDDHDAGIVFAPGDTFDCTATLPGSIMTAGHLHSDTVTVTAIGAELGITVDDADDWNALGTDFPSVSVGDYVWFDKNRDGIQNDGDDAGIEGVELQITGPDGKVVTTDADGEPMTGRTTTDEKGRYLFDNLPVLREGESYTVTIVGGVPDGYRSTREHQGDDRATDSATNAETSDIDLSVDGAHDPKLDFGFWLPLPGVDDPGPDVASGGLLSDADPRVLWIGATLVVLLAGAGALLAGLRHRRRQSA